MKLSSNNVWFMFCQSTSINAEVRRFCVMSRTRILVCFPVLMSESSLFGKRSSSFYSMTWNYVFAWGWKLVDFIVILCSWSSFYGVKTVGFAKNSKFWTFKPTHKYLFLISHQINTLILARSWILFKTFIFLYYINCFRPHCERGRKMSYFLLLILNKW